MAASAGVLQASLGAQLAEDFVLMDQRVWYSSPEDTDHLQELQQQSFHLPDATPPTSYFTKEPPRSRYLTRYAWSSNSSPKRWNRQTQSSHQPLNPAITLGHDNKNWSKEPPQPCYPTRYTRLTNSSPKRRNRQTQSSHQPLNPAIALGHDNTNWSKEPPQPCYPTRYTRSTNFSPKRWNRQTQSSHQPLNPAITLGHDKNDWSKEPPQPCYPTRYTRSTNSSPKRRNRQTQSSQQPLNPAITLGHDNKNWSSQGARYTRSTNSSPKRWKFFRQTQSSHRPCNSEITPGRDTRNWLPLRRGYLNNAPVMTTDQMSDMYAMMVSLMWNMQAWRSWLQRILDHALATQAAEQAEWSTFQKRVMKEALRWRQYIKFSKQLTVRLEHRYKDKKIVSPTRASNKTETYKDCQQEMLQITEMFNKWTQWLVAVLKESILVRPQPHEEDIPSHILCWKHFKEKVESSFQDWLRYNEHLNTCWAHKYRTIMSAWEQQDAVWVMSACGAVPSGAVAAGRHGHEVIWVARTTHKSEVLPGALISSKHCCHVYADGAVNYYTKYQVLCNADAQWVAWQSYMRCDARTRPVRVAPGVFVGRVKYQTRHLVGAVLAPKYRCYVVIFNRPFTFESYELLVQQSK